MASRFLTLATMSLACAIGHAGEFGPLMEVAQASWPARTHIAVVADYASSVDEINDLAAAAGPGATITVLDSHNPAKRFSSYGVLINRIKPDYVVLLRSDPTFRDGTPESTWLVSQAAKAGIPSIGTTRESVRQGAVFAVGADTGNQLLVNDEPKGSIHVILPKRENLRTLAVLRPQEGRAVIERVDAGR